MENSKKTTESKTINWHSIDQYAKFLGVTTAGGAGLGAFFVGGLGTALAVPVASTTTLAIGGATIGLAVGATCIAAFKGIEAVRNWFSNRKNNEKKKTIEKEKQKVLEQKKQQTKSAEKNQSKINWFSIGEYAKLTATMAVAGAGISTFLVGGLASAFATPVAPLATLAIGGAAIGAALSVAGIAALKGVEAVKNMLANRRKPKIQAPQPQSLNLAKILTQNKVAKNTQQQLPQVKPTKRRISAKRETKAQTTTREL